MDKDNTDEPVQWMKNVKAIQGQWIRVIITTPPFFCKMLCLSI